MLAILLYSIPFLWFNMKLISLPVNSYTRMPKVLSKKKVSYLNIFGKHRVAYTF